MCLYITRPGFTQDGVVWRKLQALVNAKWRGVAQSTDALGIRRESSKRKRKKIARSKLDEYLSRDFFSVASSVGFLGSESASAFGEGAFCLSRFHRHRFNRQSLSPSWSSPSMINLTQPARISPDRYAFRLLHALW